jgi:hypothetical protein
MIDARRRRWAPKTPASMLILLAPLVGEVLNGATRLSFIFAFIPQIMVWGCGVLLIRELVQRWRGGWINILALGLGLSIAVEVVILQTSVAPIPWLQQMSIPVHDRIWGVNWLWLTFMLGYESVWIVLVPILITELMFPERRHEPWLRQRGLAIAAATFVLGSFMLWILWTQIAVPIAFHQPKYKPPLWTLAAGVVAMLLLVVAGYAIGTSPQAPSASRSALPPWLIAVIALVLAFPWWGLIVLVFAPMPSVPLWQPILAAVVWATIAFLLVQRWSATSGWNDRHRWSLAFGALLACMLLGYLGSSLWPISDLVAKLVLNLLAVWYMITLAQRVWRREPA